MRAIIIILILAVIALLIAVATGFLNISQTREARAPEVSTTGNGVSAKGGQTPAFDVETGSVSLGTKQKTVAVPNVQVNPPGGGNQEAANVTTNGG
jgi:flagellar basal body-associated protein FliL